MKISLVVAQGVHSGKSIPIAAEQFLIGRDPHCNLRPASPSISKQHCGIIIRGEKVFLHDYGSTNGTVVNGQQVAGEIEVANGDQIKIGPLQFAIKIEATVARSTVKATPQTATATSSSAVAETAADSVATDAEESENAAAILLGMDDGSDPTTEAKIPDGTTVMDAPAAPGETPAAPKAIPGIKGDTSTAARDILSKYMRRPRA
jgi:pSer/pThr/pTyr-binding forkhead associated (FHA) protein